MITKTALDNGLRIVTERIEHVRSVSLGIWVDVGSRDETEPEAGLSHLLEHMIFKGTAKRSALDIAKEIDSIGGASNAFTSREFTCFHAKVLDNHQSEIVDLLTDIFLNSTFAAEELAREREVVLQEIKMVEDTPDEQVHQLMPEVLWGGAPLGRPVAGSAETVSAATPESIKAYIESAYRPERIIISAAGNLEHDRLVELLRPAFAGLNGRPDRVRPPKPEPVATHRLIDKDLEQIHLCLGLPGLSAVDPDRYAGLLLNNIFGGSMSSRLFQEVREKRGLAYSVYSFLSTYSDAGVLGTYLGVDPGRAREALEVVLGVMAELARAIDPDDLAKAKEQLKGQIYLSAESTDARMSRLAKNEFTFGRYVPYDEVAAAIDAASPDKVAELAETLLDPAKIALAALGPGAEKLFGDGWYRP